MRHWLTVFAHVILTVAAHGQSTRFRDPVFTTVQTFSNVAYGAATNPWTNVTTALLGDIYQPQSDTLAGRPAVVVIHGGGFTGGSKSEAHMVAVSHDLATRGYVVMSIDYRLAPTGTPASEGLALVAMEDAKAAVRYLRMNALSLQIDPSRIATLGGSAGAITALYVATHPSEGASGNPGWPSNVQVVISLWGMLFDVTLLDAGEPPLCLIHGTNDPVVPYAAALALQSRAALVGVPCVLHPLPGAAHAPWILFPQFRPVYVTFLYEHLTLGQLSGLAVRPGFASPGNLTLDSFGVSNDIIIPCVSLPAAPLLLPGLGTLLLDPVNFLSFTAPPLSPSSTIATAPFTLAVPAGLAGYTFAWQELQTKTSGELRLLTNAVLTSF